MTENNFRPSEGDRPFVLSIAGLDPSAGAGLLSDVKCFEQHQVYGFGICTALTQQSDDEFLQLQWLDAGQIIDQLQPLCRKFRIATAKIGLIEDLDTLTSVLSYLRQYQPTIKIVLDPILKASAGFNFHRHTNDPGKIIKALKSLNLITPNYDELLHYAGAQNVAVFCRRYAAYAPILLKGGHHPELPGTDQLFVRHAHHEIPPGTGNVHQKHGSGCVLSAAITANLALGHDLLNSCRNAKVYTEHFLNSNTSLLGYHNRPYPKRKKHQI
ncbi:phosphomethylpyrimidine kinase [Pedobacter sp. BAL39]|nr:phosphomethylpyrimidine kinase [Pedobacter sp. BAL39]